jgi:hypothetical protein
MSLTRLVAPQADMFPRLDGCEALIMVLGCREAMEDTAEDMDTDGVSLSASDRDDAEDEPPAATEQHTEGQSEALGRGRRNVARSRSRGESDDEADLRAPPTASAHLAYEQEPR